MAVIDWDEYKEYKKYCREEDKLNMVIGFVKSYYNMNNPVDIYELLANDEIGTMMFEKRAITTPESLEIFMFQH